MKKVELFTKPGLLPAMLVATILLVLMAFMPAQQSGEEGWTLVSSEQGVNAYAIKADCGGQVVYFIRIENTSRQSRTIELTYSLKDSNAFGPITEKYLLNANESKEGSCKSGKLLTLPDFDKKPGTVRQNVLIEIANR